MKEPSAATLHEYAAAIEWVVHRERERILHEVLALPAEGNGHTDLLERGAVLRVIG